MATGPDSAGILFDSLVTLRALSAVAIKATLLLGLSALLIAGTRPSSAIRHLLRTLTLVLVLALPLIQFGFPAWQADVLPEPWQSHLRAPAAVPPGLRTPEAFPSSPIVHSAPAMGPAPEAVSGRLSGSLPRTPSFAIETPSAGGPWRRGVLLLSEYWSVLVVVTWAGGFLYFMARLLLSLVCVRLAIRRATAVESGPWRATFDRIICQLDIRRPVRLLMSSRVEVALSVGVVRPAILLPGVSRTWSQERLESILLHELAHAKRWDNLSNVVSQWACAFYWYNPLIWWTASRLKVERERACDDQVLATGTRASEYVGHLLEVAHAVSSRRLWGHLELSQSSALKDRLLAALNPHQDRRQPSIQLQMAALLIGTALLFPVAAFQPWIDSSQVRPAGSQPLLSRVADAGIAAFFGNPQRTQDDQARNTVPSDPSVSLDDPLDSHSRPVGQDGPLTKGARPDSKRVFSPSQIVNVERGGDRRAVRAAELARQRELFGEARLAATRRALAGTKGSLRFATPGTPPSRNQDDPLDDLGPEPKPTFRASVERVELGSLGTGESRALDINDSGLVVGESQVSSGLSHPFLWSPETGIHDLGNPRGVHTRAVQVNDQGQVLMETFDASLIMGFVWSEATGLREIGALDSAFPVTAPRAMNRNGQVVGSSRASDGSLHAVRWTAETGLQDLGFEGWSEALAVNDAGQIVGHADGRAFFWDPEKGVQYLLDDTIPLSIATALNAVGKVVGYAEFAPGIPQAFYWAPEQGWVNLGALSLDFPISLALGINDQSQVVGQSLSLDAPGGERFARGFRWTPTDGMEDIGQALVDAPLAINAVGHIIGTYGRSGQETHPLALWLGVDQVQLDSQDDSYRESEVVAVNNFGQIVGSSLKSNLTRRAILWNVRLEVVEQSPAETPAP